jgi:hypothetical protein
MKKVEIVSVSSKKKNASFTEMYLLKIHAEFLEYTKEAYEILVDKPKGATVTLEVCEKVHDCSGPSWAHSSKWEVLGTATYVLIH